MPQNQPDKQNQGILVDIFNHFRLSLRLFLDQRINWVLKALLIVLPAGYWLVPLPDDVIPVVGFLDDAAFFILCTILFVYVCPQAVRQELRAALHGPSRYFSPGIQLDRFRHPDEIRNLAIGFLIIFAAVIVTGYLGGLLALVLYVVGFAMHQVRRSGYQANAIQVSESQVPRVYRLLQEAKRAFPPLDVNVFVTQSASMNAFTFGYREPYVIVMTSFLVDRLSDAEIKAVIGHEMGHIYFDHVRLISMMGGMQGLFSLLFFLWSRSGEYSADAVAFAVSNCDPLPMSTALFKIGTGQTLQTADLQTFLAQGEQQSKTVLGLSEIFQTHPHLRSRILRLQSLATEP